MSRLSRTVRILLLFESAMYTTLSPLLPHYQHTLHASKAAIGLLAAGYSAGLIPGSLIGARLTIRQGVRRTTLLGLVCFGLSVAAFGLVSNLAALDGLRAIQGFFCGLIWCGGLTWVIGDAAPERRGRVIAATMAAATFGTLIGPLLGTLALGVGTGAVFVATGVVAIVLAAWARRHPEPAWCPTPGPMLAQSGAALRAGGFGVGAWLVALEAIFFGAAGVLLPLRIAHLGGPAWLIGAAFTLASALSTALSPLVGRSISRFGPQATIAVGLSAGAPLLALLLLPTSPWLLGVLIVLALGLPMTATMISAVSMMTDATERAGVTLVLASMMVNLGYAIGETVGAPGAAAIAQATGDALPLLMIAGLMIASVPFALRRTPAVAAPGDLALDGPRDDDGPPLGHETPLPAVPPPTAPAATVTLRQPSPEARRRRLARPTTVSDERAAAASGGRPPRRRRSPRGRR